MRKRSGGSLEAAADADDEPGGGGGGGGSAPDWRLRFMALSLVSWYALFCGAWSPLSPRQAADSAAWPDHPAEADLALEMFGYGGPGFESVDAALRAAGCKAHSDCPVLPSSTGGGGGGGRFFCTHQGGNLADVVVTAGLKRAADQLAHLTEHGQLHDEGFDEVHLLHRASELFVNGSGGGGGGGGKGKHCLACKYCADGITFDGKCPAYCDQLADDGEL